MVWAGICGANDGQKTPILLWQKDDWGNISAATYIPHVLEACLHPFWYVQSHYAGGEPLLVMEDGASAHRAKLTQTTRERLGITRLDWVASSPDLNPIEYLWKVLMDRINRRAPRPTTQEGVACAIIEEWDKITSADILKLVDTMPTRVQAVIQANGGHTPF